VLFNLSGNATKFTLAGKIEVTSKLVNGQLENTVIDTGRGIPTENLERVSLFGYVAVPLKAK
jgi:two-component system, sensor histidine kinase ChiS